MGRKKIGHESDIEVKDKLRMKGSDGRKLIEFMVFAATDCVQDLTSELEKDFSKNGNSHYPRYFILVIIMYCFYRRLFFYSDIEYALKNDEIIKIYTRGMPICKNTIRNFLEDSNNEIIRRIFLYTLVQLNDFKLLSFLHYFIDGTDALVRASKTFVIYENEIKALEQMKKWKLLHKNTKRSCNRTIRALTKKLKEHEDDEEMVDMIDLILSRLELYNKKKKKKLDLFKQEIEDTNKNYISITFPGARRILTKKGKTDMGKNLQIAMNDNNCVIASIFSKNGNDFKTLPEILPILKENFIILKELQKEYGERNNTGEISKMIEKAILCCDAGYWSSENLKYIEENAIKALIQPKKVATYVKNKFLEILYEKEGKNTKEEVELNRKQLKRLYNAYQCKYERILKLVPKKGQNKKNKDPHKKETREYKCEDCTGCPYIDDCKFKQITEEITPFENEITNKFTNKRYLKIFKERFPKGEGINGFLKGPIGILLLLGASEQAINNFMHIRNAVYNLTRLNTMVETREL